MLIKYLMFFMKIFLFTLPFFPIIKGRSLFLGNLIEFVLLISIIMFSFFCVLISSNKFIINISYIYYILFIILFSSMLIGFNSEIFSAISGLRIYLEMIFVSLSLLVIYIYKGKKVVLNVIKYIIYSAITLSIFGLIQFIKPDVILSMHGEHLYAVLRPKSDFQPFSFYNRVMSLMNDPNIYGLFLIIAYFSVDALKDNQLLSNKHIILIKTLFIINILLTNSRQAIFLLIIYILLRKITTFHKQKGFRNGRLGIVFWILIITIASYVLTINLDSIFEFLRVDSLKGFNGRIDRYQEIINQFNNQELFYSFFGSGIQTERDYVYENSYLLLLSQFGLFTLLIILALIVIIRVNIRKSYGSKNNLRICYFITILLAMWVGDYVVIPQIMVPFLAVFIVIDLRERG